MYRQMSVYLLIDGGACDIFLLPSAWLKLRTYKMHRENNSTDHLMLWPGKAVSSSFRAYQYNEHQSKLHGLVVNLQSLIPMDEEV